MYSLLLTLVLVGGIPPTDKSEFDIVGASAPKIQMLNKDDFCLISPKQKETSMPNPQNAVLRYIPVNYGSPYVIHGYYNNGSSCTTGNCPSYTRR